MKLAQVNVGDDLDRLLSRLVVRLKLFNDSFVLPDGPELASCGHDSLAQARVLVHLFHLAKVIEIIDVPEADLFL